jgi:FRG domain
MNINKEWKCNINDDVLDISKWDDFINFIYSNEDTLKGCFYRGQRNPDWPLKPSIFRIDSESANIENLYNRQLKEFKLHTRGRHSIPYDSAYDDELKWWSLGQHYGLATPLLDWVRSPFVAAYFSYYKEANKSTSEKDKRAIFIFDFKKFKEIEDKGRGNQFNYIERVNSLTHDNDRLVSQQGELIYLSPINQTNNQTMEEVIDQFKLDKATEMRLLLKVTLPEDERTKTLYRLDQMNINQSTLFPDLSGAADYCNYLAKQRIRKKN